MLQRRHVLLAAQDGRQADVCTHTHLELHPSGKQRYVIESNIYNPLPFTQQEPEKLQMLLQKEIATRDLGEPSVGGQEDVGGFEVKVNNFSPVHLCQRMRNIQRQPPPPLHPAEDVALSNVGHTA